MRSQFMRAELGKLKAAPIWLAFVILPTMAAVIGTFNYWMNIGTLTAGWESLWTQHTLFEMYFFLPALVGTTCSWLMRLEHAGGNWNLLLAQPVAPWKVVVSKVAVGELLLGVGLATTGLLFLACGKAIGVEGLPGPGYAGFLLLAWVGYLPVVAVQLLVSLHVRNFAAPVGVAMVGSVAGLLLTVRGWALLWPYSLAPLAANTNGGGALPAGDLARFVGMVALFTAVALVASTLSLSHADTR